MRKVGLGDWGSTGKFRIVLFACVFPVYLFGLYADVFSTECALGAGVPENGFVYEGNRLSRMLFSMGWGRFSLVAAQLNSLLFFGLPYVYHVLFYRAYPMDGAWQAEHWRKRFSFQVSCIFGAGRRFSERVGALVNLWAVSVFYTMLVRKYIIILNNFINAKLVHEALPVVYQDNGSLRVVYDSGFLSDSSFLAVLSRYYYDAFVGGEFWAQGTCLVDMVLVAGVPVSLFVYFACSFDCKVNGRQ